MRVCVCVSVIVIVFIIHTFIENSFILTKTKFHQIVRNFLESDNPGSTDSEVRKILTLHIPITEYDTLGSESDNDMSARAINSAKYRATRGEFCHSPLLRPSLLILKKNIDIAETQDETSSSSETTPTSMSRKSKPPFASRKASKTGTTGKRHVRSSSGYSSHNEETTFR